MPSLHEKLAVDNDYPVIIKLIGAPGTIGTNTVVPVAGVDAIEGPTELMATTET